MINNPDMMKSMARSNPMTAQLMEQHPELEAMFSDPTLMRSIMSQESMDMAQGMLHRIRNLPTGSTMSGAPGSFPMPGSPNPGPPSSPPGATTASATGPGAGATTPNLAQPFAYPGANPFVSSGSPWGMYAPFWPRPAAGAWPGMYGQPFVPAAAPTAAPVVAPQPEAVDPRVLYKDQLAQMKDMGFDNEEINIKALKETNGDAFEAVDKIVKMLEKK